MGAADADRRPRRRLWWVAALVVLAAVATAVTLVLLRGEVSERAAASARRVRVVGADQAWHARPVRLSFFSGGAPVRARWRVDGGPWAVARRAVVAAPANHGNDGVHLVEARLQGGPPTYVRVRIDTTPPRLTRVTVRPDRIRSATTLRLAYDAPAEPGVTVDWAVVDTLGDAVGRHGAPAPSAGAADVSWKARTLRGVTLLPGTYRLRVTATDAAGNTTVRQAPFACDRPVVARLYDRLPRAGRMVALTFDGGSGYAWRHIMLVLARLHTRGTFFATGVSVSRYPRVAALARTLGMSIGNHSYDHPDFRTISYGGARRQLLRAARLWWQSGRTTPAPFFRPPYGASDARTLKAAGSAGYPFVVDWDVDTGDWTGVSSRVIARRAVRRARPGSIILMHTMWSSEKALPAIVRGLRAKGLKPVALDQLFAAAGLL